VTSSRGGPAREAWVYAAVAAAAFLPFLRGAVLGHAFYFRDLSRQFFPLRRFVIEGLRAGELRFWNPYVHEGEPVPLPVITYPPDLLQALVPHEAGFTLLLALHVPLAAVALMLLARKGLGLSLVGAAAGGLVYALGSFTLSCLNLYVYVQAVAWAPLLILGLMRARDGEPGGVVLAAVTTALCLGTTGVEMAAQAVLAGILLSWPGRSPRRALYLLASLALGAGLAAPTLVTVGGLAEDSARAAGIPTSITLAHAIHPLTLLQTVVAQLYGDPANITGRWWGHNFSTRGFPYLLSLYLGLTTLCLAAAALAGPTRYRWRLAVLAAVAVLVCLGPWVGLAPAVDALPFLRRFRYPSKAFFSVHLAVALLAGLGADALARASRRAAAVVAVLAIGGGLLLVAAPAWPAAAPASADWFQRGFFPPHMDASVRTGYLAELLADAALGGGLAVAAGLLALMHLRGRLRPGLAAAGVTVLVGVDLLRAGSGLNPMATPAFYQRPPEARDLIALFQAEGRVFTCDAEQSDTYWAARRAKGEGAEPWTFAVLRDTFIPYYNQDALVRTALSADTTLLVPTHRSLPPDALACRDPAAILPRLQEAGVANVVAVDPLSHRALRLRGRLEPPGMAPLPLYVYAVEGWLPWWSVATTVARAATREEAESWTQAGGFRDAGRVMVEGPAEAVEGARGQVLECRHRPGAFACRVEADRPTVLVVREAHARGWRATVDGRAAPVLRADGRHQAVPVPAGRSEVALRYRPPHLGAAAAIAALCAVVVVGAAARGRRRDAATS
jgi:hypothetical protein